MIKYIEYVRPAALAKELSVSNATFWRMAKTEGFPRSIKLSLNVTAFDRAEIEAWKESKSNKKTH